jgi:hypothetical protein
VSESGQKAIIAWNGTHEVLILSTDISSSNETEVVEIMPLPSNPTISKGEKQSFLKIQELVNEYLRIMAQRESLAGPKTMDGGQTEPQITITFQEIIGVHFLTVVKAEEASELIQWLENFLEARGYSKELPSGLEKSFSFYIQNEICFFVIDVINSNSTVQTVDPLIYEFAASALYYPLQISTIFSGDTDISLFTITNIALDHFSMINKGFIKRAEFQIKQEALAKISVNLTELFSSDPHLCYFQFSGALKSFISDISWSRVAPVSFPLNLDPPTVALAVPSIFWGLLFLLLFFPAIRSFSLRHVRIPITKRLQIVALSAGLIGVFLVWSGFVLPWGLVEFGKSRELLLSLNGSYTTPLLGDALSILFSLLLLATIPCLVYLLLVGGDSKGASATFTTIGACMMLLVLASTIGLLYAVSIGAFMTLAGCAFIVLAGVLSLWRIKLSPKQSLETSRTTRFQDFIARRFLVSIVTSIGVVLLVFWISRSLLNYYLW